MEFTKRYGNGFGKPELPDVTAGQHLSLSQFATADSTMFFRILSIPSALLAKPAMQWKDDEDYALDSEIINELKVCNDSAEREVKLVADFLYLAAVEKSLQNYTQAVKEDRRKIPNLQKRPFTSS